MELELSVASVLPFIVGDEFVLVSDVVTESATDFVIPSDEVVGTISDGVDTVFIALLIGTCLDERIVDADVVVFTDSVLMIVTCVEADWDFDGVLASVSSVLPFILVEESLLKGDVSPETDTVSVGPFGEKVDTNLDGLVVIFTDVLMFTCGDIVTVGEDAVLCALVVLINVTDVRVLRVSYGVVVCIPTELPFKVEEK